MLRSLNDLRGHPASEGSFKNWVGALAHTHFSEFWQIDSKKNKNDWEKISGHHGALQHKVKNSALEFALNIAKTTRRAIKQSA
jgi:hypothetical protein